MISIIIPTFNEAGNIEKLIQKIGKNLELDYEIIIVDDNSSDGTPDVARKLKGTYPLKVLERKAQNDLSLSVIEGFRYTSGDILCAIDADHSHDPKYINKMLEEIKKGYDFVIGSRLVKGGMVEDWPIRRRLISVIGRLMVRPLTSIKDPMSGFFLIKRHVIKAADLQPLGYKICLEIITKGRYNKIKEVPIKFKDRYKGKSKANLGVYLKFVRHLLRLYRYKFFENKD